MRETEVAFARGRAAYPGVALREDDFGRFLAGAVEGRGEVPEDRLPLEDLFLACACACEVPGAAEAFEAKLGRIVRRAVARVLPDAAEREDGPLAGWVSVAAIRLAVSMGRSATAERRLRAKAAGEAAGANPELLLMKGELAKEFEAAVEDALGRLSDRERLILRLYLVSGMTLAQIGRSLGVTQQAVSRQLEKIRASVLADVRGRLRDRLAMPKAELASVIRMIASRLNVSISRLL